MSFTPWLGSPFNKLWRNTDDIQRDFTCAEFELRAADCLEAYGRHHARGKCQDYLDDVHECIYKTKQHMRVILMRMERDRQWKAGERETHYAPAPAADSY